MNKTQLTGIGIIIIGIDAPILFENAIIRTTSGVLCAIGLGLIFKLLPLNKQNLPK